MQKYIIGFIVGLILAATGSYYLYSSRYVQLDESGFFTPEEVHKAMIDMEAKEQIERAVAQAAQTSSSMYHQPTKPGLNDFDFTASFLSLKQHKALPDGALNFIKIEEPFIMGPQAIDRLCIAGMTANANGKFTLSLGFYLTEPAQKKLRTMLTGEDQRFLLTDGAVQLTTFNTSGSSVLGYDQDRKENPSTPDFTLTAEEGQIHRLLAATKKFSPMAAPKMCSNTLHPSVLPFWAELMAKIW